MITAPYNLDDINQLNTIKILENNYIGYLSYIYRGTPYTTPMSYFFDKSHHKILCYSGKGHKIRALRRNPNVCLNIAEIASVNSWSSVLVHGIFYELSGSNAKTQLHQFSNGIRALIAKKEHRDVDFISKFSAKVKDDDVAIVFEIEINELSCKTSNISHF